MSCRCFNESENRFWGNCWAVVCERRALDDFEKEEKKWEIRGGGWLVYKVNPCDSQPSPQKPLSSQILTLWRKAFCFPQRRIPISLSLSRLRLCTASDVIVWAVTYLLCLNQSLFYILEKKNLWPFKLPTKMGETKSFESRYHVLPFWAFSSKKKKKKDVLSSQWLWKFFYLWIYIHIFWLYL